MAQTVKNAGNLTVYSSVKEEPVKNQVILTGGRSILFFRQPVLRLLNDHII